jgi:hypothetical protein
VIPGFLELMAVQNDRLDSHFIEQEFGCYNRTCMLALIVGVFFECRSSVSEIECSARFIPTI